MNAVQGRQILGRDKFASNEWVGDIPGPFFAYLIDTISENGPLSRLKPIFTKRRAVIVDQTDERGPEPGQRTQVFPGRRQ